MPLLPQVLAVIGLGHLLVLVLLRRAWAQHSHDHPGEGSFLVFLVRRRIPSSEFVGDGYTLWRRAGWISFASFATAALLVLIQSV